MKIAVLADIHGNLEALEAVLADLAAVAQDITVCLGDLVGYGPDPNEVVRRVREFGCVSVLGNHEAALASKKDRDWMNFQARENNVSTEALLSNENREYCCSLPHSLVLEGAHFVHGCPPDSVLTYLYNMSDTEVVELFAERKEDMFFVGHTHQLMLVTMEEDTIIRKLLKPGITRLENNGRYLVNAGSVGQPRDGDNRAKYLVWDKSEQTIEVRAVGYEVETTVKKIIDRGFPPTYATRLR